MKVIKNNIGKETKKTKSKFPMKTICEHCGSEIELEENDVEIGQFGLYYFNCPCCGDNSYMNDGINLTSDNLNFPKHYYYFTNKKNVSNEEINQYVKQCINTLRNSIENDFHHTSISTGDTYVGVRKLDEDKEFCITVAKGYYVTTIPYTEKDKEKWCK